MSSITSPAVRRRFAADVVEGSAYSNQQESTWPEAAS